MSNERLTRNRDAEQTEEQIAAMMEWGYGIAITFNAKHITGRWSVHVTKFAQNEDEEPVSVFFGGGSPDTAVALAYGEVAKWQNAKLYPCADLTDRLASWINGECLENGSNTPDFILAGLLRSVLNNFDAAVQARDKWYGVSLSPGQKRCAEWTEDIFGDSMILRAGAVIKIGKRLWRLRALPKKFQGDDLWEFECADESGGISCDRQHNFTRSELQWLVCHGALLGQPAEGDGARL